MKQNEALQQEVARLKKEAQLQKQNEALQKEIEQLKKAAGLQGRPVQVIISLLVSKQV